MLDACLEHEPPTGNTRNPKASGIGDNSAESRRHAPIEIGKSGSGKFAKAKTARSWPTVRCSKQAQIDGEPIGSRGISNRCPSTLVSSKPIDHENGGPASMARGNRFTSDCNRTTHKEEEGVLRYRYGSVRRPRRFHLRIGRRSNNFDTRSRISTTRLALREAVRCVHGDRSSICYRVRIIPASSVRQQAHEAHRRSPPRAPRRSVGRPDDATRAGPQPGAHTTAAAHKLTQSGPTTS